MVKDTTHQQRTEVIQSFVSGGIAGVLAKTAIAPFERIKFIYMTSSESFRYKAALQKTAEIVRTEGFFSLWRGNIVNCTRIFVLSAIVAV